jgi:hypothetical protein
MVAREKSLGRGEHSLLYLGEHLLPSEGLAVAQPLRRGEGNTLLTLLHKQSSMPELAAWPSRTKLLLGRLPIVCRTDPRFGWHA